MRMGSSRFPGKPLFKLCGKEMIVRTLERAAMAECFDRIVCATDSDDIAEVVSRAGFEFLLTGEAATGSDRVSFAARALDLDLVVNLQGDEPLVEPALLRTVAQTLAEHPEGWVTVACPLSPRDVPFLSVVKVLVHDGFAVDFRREIPPGESARWLQHQGIYAYSRSCRDEFSSLPQNALELERSLEQMRILGKTPIRIVLSPYPSVSVDLPSDATVVEALINEQRNQGFHERT